MCKVYLFCTRLCFSTVSFVRAYVDESTESLLDGHVRAFEFFGGNPGTVTDLREGESGGIRNPGTVTDLREGQKDNGRAKRGHS